MESLKKRLEGTLVLMLLCMLIVWVVAGYDGFDKLEAAYVSYILGAIITGIYADNYYRREMRVLAFYAKRMQDELELRGRSNSDG